MCVERGACSTFYCVVSLETWGSKQTNLWDPSLIACRARRRISLCATQQHPAQNYGLPLCTDSSVSYLLPVEELGLMGPQWNAWIVDCARALALSINWACKQPDVMKTWNIPLLQFTSVPLRSSAMHAEIVSVHKCRCPLACCFDFGKRQGDVLGIDILRQNKRKLQWNLSGYPPDRAQFGECEALANVWESRGL